MHVEDGPKLGTSVSLDFCIMGSLDAQEIAAPVWVMVDDRRKVTWAVWEWMPRNCRIHWLTFGAGKIDLGCHRGEQATVISDGEPAVTAVKEAMAAARVGNTPLIAIPVRESNGHGAV